MIQRVIEVTNEAIADLNSFAVVNGLCEYVTKESVLGDEQVTMKFPALYTSGDNLKNVTDFDFRSGVLFHIRNGVTSIEEQESLRANKEFLKYTTPIKMVAITKRSITGTDSNYSREQLANNLIHSVQHEGIQSLKSELGLAKINVMVQNYDTGIDKIDEIFQNVEIPFRHDLSLVVIEYDIELYGFKECFNNYTC